MTSWVVRSVETHDQLGQKEFPTRELALSWISRMGPILETLYEPWARSENPKIARMLNESFVQNDLEGILVPKISVDEYLPQDQKSDNIVIGLYVRGVPEAVQPLENFLRHTDGVLEVDSSDADTIPNTSIVYIEMDRDQIDLKHIGDLVVQLGMISALSPSDFTMTFPNTDKSFPFSLRTLKKYFDMRSRKANALAQKKAIAKHTKELQDELKSNIDQEKKKADQEEKQVPDEQTQPEQAGQDQQIEHEQVKQDNAETPDQVVQNQFGESKIPLTLAGLFG